MPNRLVARGLIALGHKIIAFHGGMGVTDERAIGHAHKRPAVALALADDPEAALDRLAGVRQGADRAQAA